jgi:glutathione S-transferase
VAPAAAGLALAAAVGVAGYVLGRSGHDRIGSLERRVERLQRNASALETERNRIRAERDRLEARLAAQNASPKACPDETLSTADAHLLVRFAVDYPCGWSVLEDPLQSPTGAPEREGLMLDTVFFSALPISRAPREGPLAEITLDSWYDDPNKPGDALPKVEDWIASAQKRFTRVQRTTVRTRAGLVLTKLVGSMTLFDEPRPASLYVWEWTDQEGVRKISEAFALDPGAALTKTLEALVRSFRVLGS